MNVAASPAATGLEGLVRRLVEGWALLGGMVLLGLAFMTTWSATSGAFFGRPLPGDVELVEIFIAVAIFAFLPYCQLSGANVTADLFTARAGPRFIAALAFAWAVVALAFSLLLLWRMTEGMADYRKYVETTTILRIPIWYAYVPALVSLALLAAAAVVSVRETLRDWRAAR